MNSPNPFESLEFSIVVFTRQRLLSRSLLTRIAGAFGKSKPNFVCSRSILWIFADHLADHVEWNGVGLIRVSSALIFLVLHLDPLLGLSQGLGVDLSPSPVRQISLTLTDFYPDKKYIQETRHRQRSSGVHP